LAFSTTRAGQSIVDIGRGSIVVELPSSYDPNRSYPLVLNLHGYSLTGQEQENYFVLVPWAESREFIYAYPQGLDDFLGSPFWNGTDACCDLFGNGVDDSTYLVNLVDEIRDQFPIDPWRVHFVGWSNGGFMSYRMACDHADTVASLASLAGATFLDPLDCQPEAAVHVLQIHGTSDATILYGGGATTSGSYPSATQTIATWADYNGCDAAPVSGGTPRDIDAGTPGAETTETLHEGCAIGGSARLWTIPGGPHGPTLAQGFRDGVVDFLLGHRRAALRFEDPQTLRWAPIRWAQEYRVYRGELSDLLDGDADGVADAGYGDCASGDDTVTTDTVLLTTENPAVGEGFFYLVGFVNSEMAESILGTLPGGRRRTPSTPCP